jgi:hypothetical protein
MHLTLNQLPELVNAGFSFLWLRSHEPEELERLVTKLGTELDWQVHAWDCARGVRNLREAKAVDPNALTPVTGVQAVPWAERPHGRDDAPRPGVVILHNLHRFSDNAAVAQFLLNDALQARREQRVLLAAGPVVRIPPELEKVVTVLEHPLPTPRELADIAEDLASHTDGATGLSKSAARTQAESARGLTRFEAENAFTLSLTRKGQIDADTVWELKGQMLEKTNALTLHRGKEAFDALGGLENLKDFTRRSLRPGNPTRAKGVLLLGPPGTGKSAFAKALGNETGRPTLLFDMNSLMSKFVGESEGNLKSALAVADAMAPCVLFVDEIEKALAGGGSSAHAGDSGTSKRMFGALLSWMNDHTSDVYFVGTMNDVRAMPPEFARAGRFDGVFFIDLPTREEKDKIWELYLPGQTGSGAKATVDKSYLPGDADWTGAEIRACCQTRDLLGTDWKDAANYVVPVATRARDQIEALRDWAQDKCLSASRPGRYQKQHRDHPQAQAAPRRMVARAT